MKLGWAWRLGLYAATVTFMSTYYDSWSSTMAMFVRLGVYQDACEGEIPVDLPADHVKCDKQLQSLSGLLTVFRISEFVTSIGVGVFMDLVGPKICIVAGILLRILSWFMLGSFPRNVAVMISACILCGITANAIIFPVFTVARYWPAYQDVAMCVVSICLSAGCFYVTIMNGIISLIPDVDMARFVNIKVIVTHVPWLLVAVFIFPNNLAKDIAANMTPEMSAKTKELNLEREVVEDGSWNARSFWRYIINPCVLVTTVVFIVNCISLTFAQEAFTMIYHDNAFAEKFNSVMLPLSSVFALMFMWVINRYGIMSVINFLNIVALVMHIFLTMNNTFASIVASVCISATFSGFVTFFFIIIERIVDIQYSGSMKGYLTTAAGVSLGINPLINYITVNHSSMLTSQLVFIVIRCLMILPLVWLYIQEKRNALNVSTPTVNAAEAAEVAAVAAVSAAASVESQGAANLVEATKAPAEKVASLEIKPGSSDNSTTHVKGFKEGSNTAVSQIVGEEQKRLVHLRHVSLEDGAELVESPEHQLVVRVVAAIEGAVVQSGELERDVDAEQKRLQHRGVVEKAVRRDRPEVRVVRRPYFVVACGLRQHRAQLLVGAFYDKLLYVPEQRSHEHVHAPARTRGAATYGRELLDSLPNSEAPHEGVDVAETL
ncbi:major facilitator superfamily MFS-1 protein [Babesia caballi]|uniref:Lysosomal dipeptide transporter MFSD1 n=1 Tax=Babesia caballi TaxID=5871 RepID=A0AAV4LVN5_BABCB|nr:major facilitator superfamily MFS-1 protein [Babesia caballi]